MTGCVTDKLSHTSRLPLLTWTTASPPSRLLALVRLDRRPSRSAAARSSSEATLLVPSLARDMAATASMAASN